MQIKEEYLTTIRELRDNFNAIVVSLGQISIQKANLENDEKLLHHKASDRNLYLNEFNEINDFDR